MAAQCQWQPKFHTSISTTLKKDATCKQLSINRGRITFCIWRSKYLFPSPMSEQCCTSRSTSFPVSSASAKKIKSQRGDHQYEVVNENGWKVTRMNETTEQEMMREVSVVRAKAFSQPIPFSKYLLFQGEQLSRLVYKLKNYKPDRYACLVAEASTDTPEVKQEVVGVVDATVYSDDDVLQYLPGGTEYIYISGIAVLNKFRRQKVATALLKACDVLARYWGFEYLVLRVNEEDFGARRLYTNAGYKVVSGDATWKTKWIGRRRRVLMIKQVSHGST
ncbi:hypothetical protein RDI58_014315 [Solanum bulbocastanum]|uniref:N-acetyltransferase domain-containing protein n=1 Tax=Solanum bulbocastanum TaxID=147425 RepID=A0AAN8TEQ0_SOLBU